jgi:tetratricopeptide (TPR) repeat protein
MAALNLPLAARVENAFVSYARYLGKTFWPDALALPYPHPGFWSAGAVWLSVILFVGLGVGAFMLARRQPYLFTGWFWFAGMLVPVIGLIQVGEAALADRYTYLPQVGLFVALVWGAAHAARAVNCPRPVMFAGLMLVLAAAGWQTRTQLKYWTDSGALFRHTLAVTLNNATAENQLGIWYSANGQIAEAMACFQRALKIAPDHPLAFKNLGDSYTQEGLALTRQGLWGPAMDKYQTALKLNPRNSAALYNLGNAHARQEQWAQAIACYRQALQADPHQADALNNLGFALVALNRPAEALACYEDALKANSKSAEVHNNYGILLFRLGNYPEAARHLFTAIELEPERAQFCANLGDVLVKMGKLPEAVQCYQQALQLEPDNPKFKAQLQAATGANIP